MGRVIAGLLYSCACLAYALYSMDAAFRQGDLIKVIGAALLAVGLSWTVWSLWKGRAKSEFAALMVSIGLCLVSAARGWLLAQGGEGFWVSVGQSYLIAACFGLAAAGFLVTRAKP